jgi:hypothetical protein
MSIAELIMQGTNRASESTAWVGDSLAKLGQNVGKALADREQQKQAQEMLPMFQQSMQDAMINANEGDSGLAFSKLMPFLTNPATLKNPYILPALDAGTKMIELAANDYARNIQVQAYRDRYSGGETEVVYDTPTAEQMADPNYRPSARVVPKTTSTRTTSTRSGGGGAGMGGGSLREEVIAIDQSTPLPGMEARFTDTPPEMDTSGEQKGFGFGWSYQEGYRPTADRRKSFEKEYNDFLNAPVEEQEKIKEQVQVTQEDVPEGKQVIPFRMALNPNIVGIVGPESSVEVEKIVQVFKDGSQEDRRELIKKNPLAATINDLEKADNTISSNNTLLNIHKQVDGNYSRVTTERVFQTDDPKTDTFKIFIDGNEAPDVQTDANGAEAIGIMKAKEVAALTGKYDFVRGKPTAEAPAPTQAGTPVSKEPPTQEKPISETESLRNQLGKIQAEESKLTTAEKQKRVNQINKEIKQLQGGATAKYTGGGLPVVAGAMTTGQKTRRDIERDILKIEQLVAERDRLEGKVTKQKSSYESRDDVISAVKGGQITREEAKIILQNQFGLQ